LETGVFLVSVKLIIMAYEHGVATERLEERLDGIHAALQRWGQPPGITNDYANNPTSRKSAE
jgi:hypothetical protein